MNCPKCRESLEQTGVVDVDGLELAVYQCDACVRSWEFDGQEFEVALTFAVDSAGRLLDPETLDPINLN